jgi:hypothetical protein
MFCTILIHTGKLQYLPVYKLEQKSCHYKRYECVFWGFTLRCAWSSVVVKALRYYTDGLGIDSR